MTPTLRPPFTRWTCSLGCGPIVLKVFPPITPGPDGTLVLDVHRLELHVRVHCLAMHRSGT